VNDVTRALVNAGKLAEVEVIRADIRAKQDERSIQNAESDLNQALNNAEDFLWLPPGQSIVLTSPLIYVPFTIPLNALIKAAIRYNPELQIAKQEVTLAEIDVRVARESNRPQINTSGAYVETRNRTDGSAAVDPYGWNLAVEIDWPLFDATQTRLATKQRQLSLSTARRHYEDVERRLRVNVENAYLEIERTEQQIADFQPQKDSADRNVRAIRLQYRNGLTRLTDVFDAENQMRDLDLEYLQLLVSFNKARDGLNIIVGTDLSSITGELR
jgi:outer membrane protein TolC